jgi:putative OPT family oligopeptide transporter
VLTDSTIAPHADRPYPELTWIAVGIGWFLGVIIAVSIGYAALILGFSIEGSELAAILGFGILRGILRRRSIIENNIVQTVASGVNGASSGMMFSVPAIFLLGYSDRFDPIILTFGCIAGAFLGIAFIIPLRKHMIDYERLTYPGGVAVATILKSPGAGVRKAIILVVAALASAIVHLVTLETGVSNWNLGALIGLPEYMNGIWYLSLMTIGVGFIAGRGGIAFIIGGFVAYWFVSPLLSVTGAFPLNEAGELINTPGDLRLLLYRPLGIGMLIGGAIMGVILAAPLILSAIKSMQKAATVETGVATEEMPIKLLYIAVVGAAVLLAVMAVTAVESMTLMGGISMALLGTLWIWMAGIILSEAIGRTNWSPLSGMTLVGITLLIIVTQAFGMERSDSIIAAIRPQDGVSRRCDTEDAADRPVRWCLARAHRSDFRDLRAKRGLYAWQRTPAGATGAGAGQHDRRHHGWRRTHPEIRCGGYSWRNPVDGYGRPRDYGRPRFLPAVQHRSHVFAGNPGS